MKRFARERLSAWALSCLEKAGVPPPEAKLVADSLVQTSVWGIDSHGVLRLTHYLKRMTIGSISAAAAPVVMRTGPATAQVHGQDGLGIVHATLAMEVAIEMAEESGVGVVGVGHSSHCGAMGLYTRMAARDHLVGIAMTHSSSVVVPHGGKEKFFGTNPISFAFVRKAGVPLGGVTYGYKGYGLAFAIDILCGVMNGMTFGRHINNMYEELDRPRKIGHLLVALDPERFAGGEKLEETVDAMIGDLRTQGEILFPREPELIEEQ